MSTLLEQLKKELLQKNIKLSYQRMRVLEYLALNNCHPTVDQIYTEIHKEIPTLSKTTVYNTLRVLMDAGLIRVITIEDNETRYDINLKPHGHFKCNPCGEVFDFNIDIDSLRSEGLYGFKVYDKDVYFKGVCPNCLSK